jgi:hypothetical protein
MDDTVIDVTVVAYANGPVLPPLKGAIARCLPAIVKIIDGKLRCRYNYKLLADYEEHVRIRRNDYIVAFFRIIDSPLACKGKNNLRSHEYAKARRIRWPTHDHYLLAAAIGGVNPSILVTEDALAALHAQAKREFGISVFRI